MEGLNILPLVVLIPLIGAPFLAVLGRRIGPRIGWLALAFPALAVLGLCRVANAVGADPREVFQIGWVPSLNVEFSLLADGLSLFFAFIVSGMGLLIVWYARFYLADHYAHQGRFYSYLIFFMASMLGTVLSNHLLVMFVFWELTGVASFLLIGFLHEDHASRVGARQALLITGGTGLAMLAGILLLGHRAGTYRLSELLGGLSPELLREPGVIAALLLILIGGFGKSAQFPFFFWLPNAMAAPTPVSAYLHSATMVKLGVFLCARIFPIFSGTEMWPGLLLAIGFGTMVLGSALALFQNDLKAMLAFSTVSQLGFLCGYYGLGALTGVQFDYLHVLNHTLYKGALFMIAGIIDHAAHTRDLRELGGLGRKMPLLAAMSLVCVASLAGVPGSIGFLSKELALADILHLGGVEHSAGVAALAAFWISAALNVALAVRFFAGVFLGKPRGEHAAHAHAPGIAILLPALLPAIAILIFGIQPHLLEQLFASWRVPGLQAATMERLHLWHGITPEFLLSMAALILGLFLWAVGTRRSWFGLGTPRLLRFDDAFEFSLKRLIVFAGNWTRLIQTDRPMAYLPITLAGAFVLIFGSLWRGGLLTELTDTLRNAADLHIEPLHVFLSALIALAVLGVVLLRRWTTQLIALSVSGFLVTFYFVIYRAPDLALTQILVEAVSLLLVLLLLGRFPRSAEAGERSHPFSRMRRGFNLLLAGGIGLSMTALTLIMTAQPPPDPLGPHFLADTIPLAQGQNAVNTVLVDFRGFDTLGEITVLLIATLGCLGLLLRYKRTEEEFRRGAVSAFQGTARKESS